MSFSLWHSTTRLHPALLAHKSQCANLHQEDKDTEDKHTPAELMTDFSQLRSWPHTWLAEFQVLVCQMEVEKSGTVNSAYSQLAN